jgi:hypothetical protein
MFLADMVTGSIPAGNLLSNKLPNHTTCTRLSVDISLLFYPYKWNVYLFLIHCSNCIPSILFGDTPFMVLV